MANGSLLAYLKKNRKKLVISIASENADDEDVSELYQKIFLIVWDENIMSTSAFKWYLYYYYVGRNSP